MILELRNVVSGEIRAVDLIEISVLQAHPAYGQTSVVARARHLAGLPADARRLLIATL